MRMSVLSRVCFPISVSGVVGNVLEVQNLRTEFHLKSVNVTAVDDVSFEIAEGECLGVVGESGCGKTTIGLSIMRLLPNVGHIVGGSIKLMGQDLSALTEKEMNTVRGNQVGMVFQDPLTSLNPTMKIGDQIAEGVRLHRGASKSEAWSRALEVLKLVEILDLLDRLRQELSMAVMLITHDMGVIAQRADRVLVMYAGRIAETAQTEEIFARMRHPYAEALLASVAKLDQDPSVRLVSIPGLPPDLSQPIAHCRFAARCSYVQDDCREREPELEQAADSSPGHVAACFHQVDVDPHTISLRPEAVAKAADLNVKVDEVALARQQARAQALESAPTLITLNHLVKEFPITSGTILQKKIGTVKAVTDVSVSLRRGETFGLVGESGCGKTTMGRMVVSLETPTSGMVEYEGEVVTGLKGSALRRRRRDLQMMFQDPYASLDPRMRVGPILREPLKVQRLGSAAEQEQRVRQMLDEVGLPVRSTELYPHEFSGGQRQRIGLARALALEPKLIVADEPVSALDVSIQAQILNLLKDLQERHHLTYLFISHDLAVVKYMADTIGVMYLGKLVEVGPAPEVYAHPAHPYTQALIDTIPVPDPSARNVEGRHIRGELPSSVDPPSGCRFRTRCPFAQERCAAEEPLLRPFGDGHLAACHFPLQTPTGEVPAELVPTSVS